VQEAGLNLKSPPQGPLAGHWQATGRSQAGLVLAVCYWHHDCASAGHGLAVSRILNLKHLLPWEGGPGWEVRPRSVQGETDPAGQGNLNHHWQPRSPVATLYPRPDHSTSQRRLAEYQVGRSDQGAAIGPGWSQEPIDPAPVNLSPSQLSQCWAQVTVGLSRGENCAEAATGNGPD